jgi:hypothetical protein
VLLKGRQQVTVVEGWWPKAFQQTVNVTDRGFLEIV